MDRRNDMGIMRELIQNDRLEGLQFYINQNPDADLYSAVLYADRLGKHQIAAYLRTKLGNLEMLPPELLANIARNDPNTYNTLVRTNVGFNRSVAHLGSELHSLYPDEATVHIIPYQTFYNYSQDNSMDSYLYAYFEEAFAYYNPSTPSNFRIMNIITSIARSRNDIKHGDVILTIAETHILSPITLHELPPLDTDFYVGPTLGDQNIPIKGRGIFFWDDIKKEAVFPPSLGYRVVTPEQFKVGRMFNPRYWYSALMQNRDDFNSIFWPDLDIILKAYDNFKPLERFRYKDRMFYGTYINIGLKQYYLISDGEYIKNKNEFITFPWTILNHYDDYIPEDPSFIFVHGEHLNTYISPEVNTDDEE